MPSLSSILTPERCRCSVAGSTQRKVFETLADGLCEGLKQGDRDAIVQAFIEREKLGSTALGHGIAIPHSRIDSCDQVLGCLITLEKGIDMQAPDEQTVDIFFALIVPDSEEGNSEHLDVLAQLASGFQDNNFCKALRACSSDSDLYQSYLNYQVKQEAS